MAKKNRRPWIGALAGALACIGVAASVAFRSVDPLARVGGYVVLVGGMLLLAGLMLNRRRGS